MASIAKTVQEYMAKGYYSPETLFVILQTKYPGRHYAALRKAIHVAKSGIFKDM